jgi:GntR family transcriptional regulator
MLQHKKSKGAIYRQLAEEIAADILSGEHAPGTRLPGEMELAQTRNLSRTTVRLAMKQLEQDGLIFRRRGEGTFVSSHSGRTRPACGAFDSFVRDHAHRLQREVVTMEWTVASPALATALKIPKTAPVLYFRRLDRLDNRPLSYDDGWIVGLHAHALSRDVLADFDFFARWQTGVGPRLCRSDFELYADAADKETAGLLGIRRDSPVLIERSDLFSEEGAAGRIVTRYRHDLYRFKRVFHYQ